MLSISLWQPWATLLVNGEKKAETRSWAFPRKLPCVLAIHAAKKWNRELSLLACSAPFRDALLRCGCHTPTDVPLGRIVGVVRVAECWPTIKVSRKRELTEQELAFGDYSMGRYAWACDEFCVLAAPIPHVGRQSLFDWTPPAELILPEWATSKL